MNHASQNTITQNIKFIRTQITEAETKHGRQPGSVKLLAVSETRPIEDVLAAFGEQQLAGLNAISPQNVGMKIKGG